MYLGLLFDADIGEVLLGVDLLVLFLSVALFLGCLKLFEAVLEDEKGSVRERAMLRIE